ncbi:MAG TPA: hypothetical protein VK327_01530 [Candidatus Paceibacterota bacterium]|nr:hypothetical protein [Candidatus Paceibacterota bacterium]
MDLKKNYRLNAPRLTGWGWLAGLCGVAGIVLPARGQYDPDWARNFRVGAMTGFNIKADMKLKAGVFGVSSKAGKYDDGYVYRDPKNKGDDFTSNWGYEKAGSFDAGTQTLTLHRTTGFDATSVNNGKTDDSFSVGFDMEYGGYPWRWERMRLGFNLGFGFLPLTFSQKVSMTGTTMEQADSFKTMPENGVPTPFFPPPGYHGSAGGDGWNIQSTATPGTPEPGGIATATGTETLDVSLFAFRVGPSLFFDLSDKFGLAVGAGPAFGFISGDYKFDETISTSTRSHGQFGVSDFVFGGYVNATLTYHATLNGDFYLGAQYMPLGKASLGNGSRQATLDLSGAVLISAGINWPF